MKTPTRRLTFALTALLALLAWSPDASAVVLTDLNSRVDIDQNSQAGAYNWVVDGTDMLYQQWFWYRIGSTGPEHSIDTISAPVVNQLDPATVRIGYAGGGVAIDLLYSLFGGAAGSTQSDLGEQIRIRNTGTNAISFHFFQYSDFDLCDIGGDTVNVESGSRVVQADGTCSLTETVVLPAANLWEANVYSSTLTSLNNATATTLNGNSVFGPGDATWAYQWDLNLGAGDSFLISKNKSIQPIPEPGTLTLIGIGAGLAGLARRRRKA